MQHSKKTAVYNGHEYKININSYERADEILSFFSKDEAYLRSLIENTTCNRKFAFNLDYAGLLHIGNKIKAVAEKILKSRQSNPEKAKEKTLEEVVHGKNRFQPELF